MNSRGIIGNRYELVKMLGEGQAGQVYLAHDRLQDGCPVALKIWDNPHPHWKESLRSEFTTLTKLRHPNIAEVYDFGTTEEGEVYFTSEWVDGVELMDFEIELPQLAEVVVQICRGLEYIHSRGLIHYDIKPFNIMVVEKGDSLLVKIVDFSLAGQATNTIKGTIEYIAPEIIKGLPVDHRADLYSLGITLYQAITGELPFAEENRWDIIRGHLHDESARFFDRLPPEWRGIIAPLLEVDPTQRLAGASAVIKEINHRLATNFEVDTESTSKSYIFSGQCIGRDDELQTLQGSTKDLLPNAGESPKGRKRSRGKRVCIISGESGIGKSRLLRELQYFLQLNHLPILHVTCSEGWEGAYQALGELLQQSITLFPTFSDRGRELWEQILSANEDHDEDELSEEENPPIESHNKLKFLDQLTQHFIEIALEQPYILLVDDLHLADEGTQDWFEYLVRNLYISQENLDVKDIVGQKKALVPILVYAAFDRTRDHNNFKSVLARLTLDGEAFELPLRRLQLAEVRHFLLAVFNWEEVPSELVDLVYDNSRGNPLYLEELLHTLVEDGVIQSTGEGWTYQVSPGQKTESLDEILKNRLEKVDRDHFEVLEWLAVINRPATLPLLERVSECSFEDLRARADRLVEKKFLKKNVGQSPLTLSLPSASHRKFIYQQMSKTRRKKYHRQVVDVLEVKWRKSSTIPVEELVEHYLQVGLKRKTVRHGLTAAFKNRDIHANDRAAYYFQKVLENVSETSEKGEMVSSELAKIYELQGEFELALPLQDQLAQSNRPNTVVNALRNATRIRIQLGEFERARDDIRWAMDELDFLRQKDITQLKCGLASIYISQGRLDEGIEFSQSVLDTLGKKVSPEKATLFNNLGVAYFLKNQYEKAHSYFLDSLKAWKELENPSQTAKILINLGNCALYLGNPRQAAQYYTESLQTFREIDDLYNLSNSLNNLGALYLWINNFKKSLRYNLESYRIRRKIGHQRGIAMSLCNIGRAYTGLGKYVEAIPILKQSLEQYNQMVDAEGMVVARVCLVEIYNFLGHLEKSRKLLKKARDLAGKADQHYQLAEILRNQGKLAEIEEKFEEAEESYREAFSIFERLQTRKGKNMVLLELISLKLSQNQDEGEITPLLHQLELLKKEIAKDVIARYHLVRAQIKFRNKDLNSSFLCLKRALEVAEQIEDPALEMEVHHQLGQFHHKIGKYATAGKHYIAAMEKIKSIYATLPKSEKQIFLEDKRRQQIKDDMYYLKEEAEKRENEIMEEIIDDEESSERLFQNLPDSDAPPLTTEEVDKIYLNPFHFRKIWEEHQLLVQFQKINEKINAGLNLSLILPTIIDGAMEMTGADMGVLVRSEEGKLRLRFDVAYDGERKVIEGVDEIINFNVVHEVLTRKKPRLVTQPQLEKKKYRHQERVGKVTAVLCVPIRIKGAVVGVLYLERHEGHPPFSQRHLDILNTFAHQAAISIEHAWLNEKLAQAQKLLETKVNASQKPG